MLRLLLAVLISLPSGLPGAIAEEGGDKPANLLEQPSLVSAHERVLLASAGYAIQDGFVRRAQEAPLTAGQLRDLLAALEKEPTSSRVETKKAGQSNVGGERARVVIERVERMWDKRTGQELGSSLTIFDGQAPSGRVGALGGSRPDELRDAVAQAPGAFSGAFSAGSAASPYSLVRVSASEGQVAAFSAGATRTIPLPRAAGLKPGRDARKGPVATQTPTQTQTNPAQAQAGPPAQPQPPAGRLASIFLSQDMVNEIVKSRLEGSALRDISVELDPVDGDLLLRGVLRVPTESLDGLNLDQVKVPDFHFQVSVNLKTTKEGYVALVFPLEDTYFYPAGSKDPAGDRIKVPLPFLQLALATARGYIDMLSGDFSGLDHQAQSLRARMSALDKKIAAASDADARQELQDERAQLDLKLQGLAIQRRQAERTAKKVTSSLHFISEKEIHLNQILESDDNALVFKLDLQQFTPFLKGIQLGGIRILKDTQDGSGENFVAIDLVPRSAAGAP